MSKINLKKERKKLYHSSNSCELHSCVVIMVSNPDGLFLHTKSLLSASNLEAVAVKFTG